MSIKGLHVIDGWMVWIIEENRRWIGAGIGICIVRGWRLGRSYSCGL